MKKLSSATVITALAVKDNLSDAPAIKATLSFY